MADVEIREHVMAFEPDKCGHCGSLFTGVTVNEKYENKFSDVTVQYECGSADWFSTWTGSRESAKDATGVIGIHVGEIENPYRLSGGDQPSHWPVYLRRVLMQKGDCFRRENEKLKAKLAISTARLRLLEAAAE